MEFFIILSFLFILGNPLYAQAYGYNRLSGLAVVLISLAVYAIVYAFKAIGLYTMAKRAGKQKLLWCAFVPFASTFLIGELAGDFRLGTARMKHIGLYAMILEFVLCIFYALQYFPQLYIFSQGEGVLYNIVRQAGSDGGGYISIEFTSALNPAIYNMMNIAYILEYVFYVLYTIAAVFMFIAFFKRYSPLSYIWMVVVCAIIPLFAAFLIFAYRNRKPVDYDKFMAARSEQIRRMQAAQYGGYPPYGQSPYGNPYNQPPYGQPPYGNPNGQGAPKNAPEDPFGEFGSSSKPSDDDPFGEFSGGGNKKDGSDQDPPDFS